MADTPRRVRETALARYHTDALGGVMGGGDVPLLDAIRLVGRGLPWSALERFRRAAGWSLAELAPLIQIPLRTLDRRRRERRLRPDESDRLVRLARVFQQARSLFEGNAAGARRWLETPVPAFAGLAPLDLVTTDPGAREVEALIGRLEHGIPS